MNLAISLLLATSQMRTRPDEGCGCNATSIGAERRTVDDLAVSNSAISWPAKSQRCPLVSPLQSEVHIVGTEHREGRRVFVV